MSMHCGIMKADARRPEGFTLLEVLVALAILAIAVVVVMQVFSANLRNLSASEQQVIAATRAAAYMREILEDEKFPDVEPTGAEADGYRFSVALAKILEERYRPIPYDLYQVTLTVAWNEANRGKTIQVQGYKMVDRK